VDQNLSKKDITSIKNKLSEKFDKFLWPFIILTPFICGLVPFIINSLKKEAQLTGMNFIDYALVFTMVWVACGIAIIIFNNLRINSKIKRDQSQFVKKTLIGTVSKLEKQRFKDFNNQVYTDLLSPHDLIILDEPNENELMPGTSILVTIEEKTNAVLDIQANSQV